MKEKAWEHRPLRMCQQTHERWRSEPCLKHCTAETVHPEHSPCIAGSVKHAQSKSKATCWLSWQSNDCTCWLTLTYLHYNTSLSSFTSFMGLFVASQQDEFILQRVSSSTFLGLFITPKHWEAVICIYIRSLVQAKGLLAHGALVFPSAVSSDSRHASPGNLCAACICP